MREPNPRSELAKRVARAVNDAGPGSGRRVVVVEDEEQLPVLDVIVDRHFSGCMQPKPIYVGIFSSGRYSLTPLQSRLGATVRCDRPVL